MREKLPTVDGVGQNLPWGNVMPQHSAAISTMNARPFDAAQLSFGQSPQNVLYVPSVGKQKQVRFLDRLGADTFSSEY